MQSPVFAKNQIVFARIRGYPRWPGKIYNLCRTSKAVRYVVYLYGFDRLMKFNATELYDYGDYILQNTKEICDLLVYARAVEDAKEEFRLSQIQRPPDEVLVTHAAKTLKFPPKKVSSVENGKSYLPLLRPLVEKKQTAEDAKLFDSQESDGELGELQAELKLLSYDYQIKSYASLKKLNPQKCLTYLWKLRKLRPSQFVLNRNVQILQTLERLRNYTGDSKKWKLASEDRENFVYFAQKIRKLANIIWKSFRKIANQNDCCPKNVTTEADVIQNSKNLL